MTPLTQRHWLQSFQPRPQLSMKSWNIVRRQWLVTQKLWKGALSFVILEPLITLLGMGLGLGQLLPSVDGMRYLGFVAIGLMIFTPANIALLETMYGGFSRLQHQRTWEGIMDTSMSLDDVIFGEVLWAAMRGTTNALALWVMASLLGAFDQPLDALMVVGFSALVAMMSSAIGMILLGFARTYDVFMLFHTLVFLPATFLSGVFFPLASLPVLLQKFAGILPFAPLIHASRAMIHGQWLWLDFAHGVLLALGYLVLAYWLSVALIRRRLMG